MATIQVTRSGTFRVQIRRRPKPTPKYTGFPVRLADTEFSLHRWASQRLRA
jgi:hypothetical protein